jgi:hypothetical protein
VYWWQYYEDLSLGQSSIYAYVYDNFAFNGVGGPNLGAPAQMLEGPEFFDGGPTPTPEPVTFAFAGGALIALGHLVRRRHARLGSK